MENNGQLSLNLDATTANGKKQANDSIEKTVNDSNGMLSVVRENNHGMEEEMQEISSSIEDMSGVVDQLQDSIRCFKCSL